MLYSLSNGGLVQIIEPYAPILFLFGILKILLIIENAIETCLIVS